MSASRPRLKLHHLLLAVNLAVLWLPLLGLEALRLYASALVRQTESELIAQAAFVAAGYRAVLARLAPQAAADPDYGLPLAEPWWEQHRPETRWRPRPAQLDLAVVPAASGPHRAARAARSARLGRRPGTASAAARRAGHDSGGHRHHGPAGYGGGDHRTQSGPFPDGVRGSTTGLDRRAGELVAPADFRFADARD
ncbi:MAG: hypothetical protein R6X17_04345 [Candidatus Competibacteraceae bacterium]